MRNFLATTALVTSLSATLAAADPSVMVGLSVNFGGDRKPAFGITSKVLSSDASHDWVAAAGVTWFFDDGGYLGLDAGIGRTFDDSAITLTYDFLNHRPQLSAGWADVC